MVGWGQHLHQRSRLLGTVLVWLLAGVEIGACYTPPQLIQPLDVSRYCGEPDPSWLDPSRGPILTMLCGFEGEDTFACSDTRLVQVGLGSQAYADDWLCEATPGYAPLFARHHPIVDECLSPEDAAELFGVVLCLREEE